MKYSYKTGQVVRQFLICCVIAFFSSSTDSMAIDASPDREAIKNSEAVAGIPYYFYAIHIEPYNRPTQREEQDKHYPALKQMIAKADSYNIKLTLMFAAPWVDYILESPERTADLESWKKSGHEIAIHHHAIHHGMRHPGAYLEDWDGYAPLPRKEAIAHRNKLMAQIGKTAEPYFGNLNDLIDKLKLINPNINSGCTNIGGTRKSLPDAIIYDTCAEFPNFGGEVKSVPAFVLGAQGGKNDYILAGTYKGIERKFLSHYFMNPYVSGAQGATDSKKAVAVAQKAADVFNTMKSGVYGTVNHGEVEELGVFMAYLDFLHSVDPEGKMSKTLTEVIEEKLIPEKRISDELMNHSDQWTGF